MCSPCARQLDLINYPCRGNGASVYSPARVKKAAGQKVPAAFIERVRPAHVNPIKVLGGCMRPEDPHRRVPPTFRKAPASVERHCNPRNAKPNPGAKMRTRAEDNFEA